MTNKTYNKSHCLNIQFEDGTEFIIEKMDQSEYRVVVHNKFIHYEKQLLLFCDGDRQEIADGLAQLVYGNLKEVKTVGTTEPDLTFVLCPKGAKVIRCESDVIQDNCIIAREEYYGENTLKIELDLCIGGVFNVQYWTRWLTAEETEEFATQWVVRICED